MQDSTYSRLGPFSRSEAEYINFPTANHDPMFGYRTAFELVGVEAFFADSGKTQVSGSHHGTGYLTITFIDRRVVLCESLDPFCAHYVGASDDMERLKTGFASRFGDDLEALGIHLENRFTDGLDAEDVTAFVETIYDAEDYHGHGHIKTALEHIGVAYDREFVSTEEIDKEAIERRIERLKVRFGGYGRLVKFEPISKTL